MRILLAEDRHQYICTGHFLLAVRRRLHVHDRALDHTLEAERRLGVDLARAGHGRGVVTDEIGQGLAQVVDIDRACTQDFSGRGIVEERKQQVLHGNELVPCLSGFDKGHV